MSQLYDEKDLWRKATYSLAVKVTSDMLDEHNSLLTFILQEFIMFESKYFKYFSQIIKINKLHLVRRLNISEQTWAKTADHFTVFLTAKVLKVPNILFC